MVKIKTYFIPDKFYRIECKSCGLSQGYLGLTRKQIVKKWNLREIKKVL